MTDAHDVSILAVPRDHHRRPDWIAACQVCGWTGEPHPNPSTAAKDGGIHLKLNAPKGKE